MEYDGRKQQLQEAVYSGSNETHYNRISLECQHFSRFANVAKIKHFLRFLAMFLNKSYASSVAQSPVFVQNVTPPPETCTILGIVFGEFSLILTSAIFQLFFKNTKSSSARYLFSFFGTMLHIAPLLGIFPKIGLAIYRHSGCV